MLWSIEQIALLRDLWASGLSASEIAAKLGPGFSHNTVLGKVQRLGIYAQHGSRKPDREDAKPQSCTDPVAQAATTPVPVADTKAKKLTLLDLGAKSCKWPFGHPDESDFHFCGQPAVAGFPYCRQHCSIAYQPVMPRRTVRMRGRG